MRPWLPAVLTAGLLLVACGAPAAASPAAPTASTPAPSAAVASPEIASPATAPESASVVPSMADPSSAGAAAPSGVATAALGSDGVPAFSHVFVVVMENHTLAQVLASGQAPTFTSLARQGAVAANYYAITHPSEPNYLALIGGDFFGVNSDSTSTRIDAPTLVDQLEAKQRTWKAYMEGLPAPGSLVPSTGGASVYAKKHDPFVLFSTIVSNPSRLQRVVPASQLTADLQTGQTPDFSFIVPDMCHDMHDCGISTGDAYLAQLVAAIQASPAWDGRAALFLTFDESDGPNADATCCGTQPGGGLVGLIALSPLARAGFTSQAPYNHYSLLRTIEDAWQLGPLGHSCDPGIQPMVDLFSR